MSTSIRRYNGIEYSPTDMELYSEQLAKSMGLILPETGKLGRGGRLGTHGEDAAGIVRCMNGRNVGPHICYSRVFVLPHEYSEKIIPRDILPLLTDGLIRDNPERVAQEEIYLRLPWPAGYKHLGLSVLYEKVVIGANHDDRRKIEEPRQRITRVSLGDGLLPETVATDTVESVLLAKGTSYNLVNNDYIFPTGVSAYREVIEGLMLAGFREDLVVQLRAKAKQEVDKWASTGAWSIASKRAEREGLWEEAAEYSRLASEKFSAKGDSELARVYLERAQRFGDIARAWSGLRPQFI